MFCLVDLLAFLLFRLIALVFGTGCLVIGWILVYRLILSRVPVFRAILNISAEQ